MSGKGFSSALGQAPRLGLHHFAHLRAVAEGLSVAEAEQRYLGAERGGESRAAHRALVERVAAVARRRGDARWRLLGIEIREAEGGGAGLAPPLHAWAEAQGLEDWPEAELPALHAERFGAIDPGVLRRQVRNARLRARRLALLRELEAVAAERAAPGDLLEGWLPAFGPVKAGRLAGLVEVLLGQAAALSWPVAVAGRQASALLTPARRFLRHCSANAL